jgi:CubicO group peptidase (beta-lactamase class C family)
LDLAINYPERVDKLVLGGANFRPDGLTDEFLEEAENLSVETFPPELAELFYLNIAPDPDHFPVFLEKISQMWLTQPNYTLEELGSITAPALIIDGDLAEAVRPEHTQEMAQAIPGAELRLIPDVGTLAPVLKPREWNEAVLTFLREPEATSELDSATVATIEAAIEDMMQEFQVPGCAISVVQDGQMAYAKGFGVSDIGTDQPVTTQSVFHLASVSKTATVTGIMQLAAEGKIDLDAPVTDYLPYFMLEDALAQNITIRQLLSHTAGVPDVVDWMADFQSPELDDEALERQVRGLSTRSLLFDPGEGWDYSSAGFNVLGDVIAKVSGQSYEDYVQEHIFTPLGMTQTSSSVQAVDSELLVSPHVIDETGQVAVNPIYPYSRAHGPSNNLYSNVEDMARYALAHLNRGELDGVRILPESAYDQMWTPVAETWFPEEIQHNYGLGWTMGTHNQRRVVGHGGLDFGYNAYLGLMPDQSTGFFLACNYAEFGDEIVAPVSMVADSIVEALLSTQK